MAMMGTSEANGSNRATVAAEAAVKCPLLEEVNLQGAKGILVNITSGYNLTLGEFEDVGATVREFADEDATIIVGSVFDATLEDQLRVTVVATGLRVSGAKPGLRGVGTGNAPLRRASGEIDYTRLDKPTVNRRTVISDGSTARKLDMQADQDMDFLDVPAFLRKQAD
jgi:cell division protein FtsZ